MSRMKCLWSSHAMPLLGRAARSAPWVLLSTLLFWPVTAGATRFVGVVPLYGSRPTAPPSGEGYLSLTAATRIVSSQKETNLFHKSHFGLDSKVSNLLVTFYTGAEEKKLIIYDVQDGGGKKYAPFEVQVFDQRLRMGAKAPDLGLHIRAIPNSVAKLVLGLLDKVLGGAAQAPIPAAPAIGAVAAVVDQALSELGRDTVWHKVQGIGISNDVEVRIPMDGTPLYLFLLDEESPVFQNARAYTLCPMSSPQDAARLCKGRGDRVGLPATYVRIVGRWTHYKPLSTFEIKEAACGLTEREIEDSRNRLYTARLTEDQRLVERYLLDLAAIEVRLERQSDIGTLLSARYDQGRLGATEPRIHGVDLDAYYRGKKGRLDACIGNLLERGQDLSKRYVQAMQSALLWQRGDPQAPDYLARRPGQDEALTNVRRVLSAVSGTDSELRDVMLAEEHDILEFLKEGDQRLVERPDTRNMLEDLRTLWLKTPCEVCQSILYRYLRDQDVSAREVAFATLRAAYGQASYLLLDAEREGVNATALSKLQEEAEELIKNGVLGTARGQADWKRRVEELEKRLRAECKLVQSAVALRSPPASPAPAPASAGAPGPQAPAAGAAPAAVRLQAAQAGKP